LIQRYLVRERTPEDPSHRKIKDARDENKLKAIKERRLIPSTWPNIQPDSPSPIS